MTNVQFIEVLRIRYFLEHNSEQVTRTKSEFTIKSNSEKNPVDNIFLTFGGFLPNLDVVDAEGTKYPIMTNKDTRTLLKIMKEKDPDSQYISQLLEDFNDHKITLIWIKVPPNKKLQPNEVRILNLNFENEKMNRTHNRIYLNVSSNLPFPVFWILKNPQNFNITDERYYTMKDNKLLVGSWSDKTNNIFFDDGMVESSSILVKPYPTNIWISYSFTPDRSIVTLPIASLSLLIAFSISLIVAQCYTISYADNSPKLVEDLLDLKIELSLFIVSGSLIIPRFINNAVIRHRYFWWYFVPIGIIACFLVYNLFI